MFNKLINELVMSESLENAQQKCIEIRQEFNNLNQPIEMIAMNRELLDSTLDLFLQEFNNPYTKDMNIKNVLMLKGFTVF